MIDGACNGGFNSADVFAGAACMYMYHHGRAIIDRRTRPAAGTGRRRRLAGPEGGGRRQPDAWQRWSPSSSSDNVLGTIEIEMGRWGRRRRWSEEVAWPLAASCRSIGCARRQSVPEDHLGKGDACSYLLLHSPGAALLAPAALCCHACARAEPQRRASAFLGRPRSAQ